jgi:hypothetical protein
MQRVNSGPKWNRLRYRFVLEVAGDSANIIPSTAPLAFHLLKILVAARS